MSKKLLILIAAVVMTGRLQAGVIPNVTISEVSSEYSSGVDQRRATNLVNGVGLFGDVQTSAPQGAMWLTSPATAGAVSQAYVIFDLGSVHTLSQLRIWNYNEGLSGTNRISRRGVKSMDILTAGEDQIFTTNFPNQTLTRGPGVMSTLHDVIDMGGLQARYIRFNVITNYGTPGDLDNRVGLSEVQFVDNSVVPTVKLVTRNLSADRVTVQFSEGVQEASATNIANYTLQSGATTATISNAVLNTYNDTVTLTTSPLNTNLVYTLTAQNIRDSANTVTFANTPTTVENELTVWLKADVGVVDDGTGFVTQWNDQSGLNNNAVQPTAGSQPTLVAGAVNGKPALHFDGTTALMEVPQSESIQANRDISIFLVLSSDDLNVVAQSPISKCPVNVPGTFDIQIPKSATGTGKISILRGNGSGYTSFTSSGFLVPNQYYLISFIMRGTNASQYLNGNFSGEKIILSGIGDSGTPIRLGIRQDAATRFVGNLAEVMMFRGAVTDLEKGDIEQYLGDKYGISVVALEIVDQPQDTTVEIGKTATFGVHAVAGTPDIFYQWRSNTVNIAGATNATYTTPPLTSAANGASYTVIASTSVGNITSSPAILTVVPDTHAPTVLSASKVVGNPDEILVVYSESVDGASATTAGNYALNGGATVSSAVVGNTPDRVVLTTSGMAQDGAYSLTVQNVSDQFSNGMVQSTQLVLPANLSLWLKADDGVSADGSGFVNKWLDHSPNANNAVQFTSSAKPLLTAGSINGQPTLTFDGNDFLEAASSPSLAITNDITLYVVTRLANLPANGYAEMLGKTLANQPAPYDYYVHNGGNGNPLYRGNGVVNGRLLATAIPSFGEPHVMNVIMNAGNVNHFLDGKANGSGVITTTIADAGTPLRIGSRDALDVFMNGEIAEIMIFNSAITDTEKKAIDSYLGAKYFPFTITEQPQSVARLEGQTASFSVAATAGPAAFGYQWQKGTQDIPGATNASYTTPVLTLADDGSTYRVLITPFGSSPIASDSATLTVQPDTELPTVISAGFSVWNTNQIVVVFSEAVSSATATNLSSYALDNGATITSAQMGSTPDRVILTVSNFTPGNPYSLTVQNVKDLFNNTISTTVVASGVHPASLALWLKADAGVSADGSSLVTTWADQSGNGNNAFQVTPDTAPVFTNTVEGFPAISFDGTNQYLAVLPSTSVNIAGDLTIYVVAQIRDFTSTENEIGLVEKSGAPPSGNQPQSFDFYLLKTSGLPRLYRGDGTVNGSMTGLSAPPTGTTHSIAVTMSGVNASMYLDGAFNGSGIIDTPMADGGGALGIGTRNDFRPKMNGNMQEILLFSSALSEADRTAIDNYLAAKYGILIGGAPEISVTHGAGNTIVLSWPTPNLNLVLQSTSDIGGLWATASETVTSAGGTNSVTINASTGNKFYRLHQE